MNKETFLRIFGGIDDTYIQRANEDVNLWQQSQEGVVVRPSSSRRSAWRTVIAAVVCTAAALFGVFVLLLKVGRIDFASSSEKLSSIRIAFDVAYSEKSKQYGEFTASRDTVSVNFSQCRVGAALVEFHRDSYDGPVEASLIIPCTNSLRPGPNNSPATWTTSLSVQKGTAYYITVSTYDDWIETIGSVTIWY